MSFAMTQLFKGISATPAQRLVAYMLADAHNEETSRCDLSVASLVTLTSLSERTIQAALKGLESAGHISRTFRKGTSTQYNLHPRNGCTPPADSPPQPPHPSPAVAAPLPPQPPHLTPATAAPKPERTRRLTRSEPSTKAGKPPKEVKDSKPDWRAWNTQQATSANAVPTPLLAPPEFSAAWTRYRAYRTRRATDARISSEAIAWTVDAAEASLRGCERAADAHGWPAVIARIDEAIAGRWQGINLEGIRKPQGFQRKPASPGAPAAKDFFADSSLGKTHP